MTILIVADLHSQKKIIAPLAATLERLRPDVVFCMGDLTVPGPSAGPYTEAFLDACGADRRPVLCVSGNNDDPACLAVLRSHGCLLDYAERTVQDVRVVGIGYEPPAEPFFPDLSGAILLTHVPPRKQPLPPGLVAVPRFHFSGHIHSAARTWQYGETTVVQVPTAMQLRAATLSLPEGTVSFISLA